MVEDGLPRTRQLYVVCSICISMALPLIRPAKAPARDFDNQLKRYRQVLHGERLPTSYLLIAGCVLYLYLNSPAPYWISECFAHASTRGIGQLL